MKRIILLLIIILIKTSSFAQSEGTETIVQEALDAKSTNPNKALELFSQIVKTASPYDTILPFAYEQMGDIFSQKHLYDKAIRLYLNASRQTEKLLEKHIDKNLYKNLHRYYHKIAILKLKDNELYASKDFMINALMSAYETGDTNLIADSYMSLANLFHFMAKYKLAEENYNKALRLYENLNTEKFIKTLYLLGNIYLEQNEYKKALDYYFEALRIADENQLDNNIPELYTALAKLFYKLNINDKTLIFAEKSLSYSIDSLLMAKNYLLIGKSYYKLKKNNLAAEYLEKAKKIFFTKGAKRSLAETYDAIGRIYIEQNQLDKAYRNISKGLLLREQMNFSNDIAESNFSMAMYFLKNNQPNRAKYYLIKANNELGKQNDYSTLRTEVYKNLAQIYLQEGKIEKSLALSRELNQIYDSLLTGLQQSVIEKYEIEREAEQKEAQIQQQLENSIYWNKHLLLFIVLLFFLSIITIYFLWLSRKRYRQLAEQEKIVQSQSSIIEKQHLMQKRLFIAAQFTKNNIFIVSPEGTLVWTNESFKETYKKILPKQENINLKAFPECKHIIKAIDKCIATKQNVEYTSELKLEEKSIWVHTTLSPLIENGKIKEIIGVESDITSLIIAEEKIKKQKKELENKNKLLEEYNKELLEQKLILAQKNEELRQQQEELRANTEILTLTIKRLKQLSVIVSETDNITYTLDPDGNITWANKALYRKTGYNMDEFVKKFGKNIRQFSQYENIEEEFNKCLFTKQTVSFTAPFKTKHGHKIWLHSTLTPVLNEKREVEQIVVIDTDITKLKETEEKLAKQNHEIRSSIEYASRIQKATLPMPIFMEALFGNNYFIFNQPRDIVSGDFYWLSHKNNKIIFAVADATGHGIPGAFMSVLGTMALHMTLAKTRTLSSDKFLTMLKDMIIRLLHQRGKSNEAKDSIDMALCIFDFEKHILEFSGAYIPAYIIDRTKEQPQVYQLKADKTTIGFDDKKLEFSKQVVQLNTKMNLFITTDGYIDQFGGENGNKKFKRKRFIELLKSIAHLSPSEQHNQIVKTFVNWKGDNIQVDDVLVFGLKIDENLLEGYGSLPNIPPVIE